MVAGVRPRPGGYGRLMSEPFSSDPGLDDPDLAAARGQEPAADDDYDALKTDELEPEAADAGWDPPDALTMPTATGRTAAEELAGETLDERLRQEEPEVTGPLDDVVVDDPGPETDTERLASDAYVPTPQAEDDGPLLIDDPVATAQADGDDALAGEPDSPSPSEER